MTGAAARIEPAVLHALAARCATAARRARAIAEAAAYDPVLSANLHEVARVLAEQASAVAAATTPDPGTGGGH